jgi:hypothetical protein
MKGGGRRIVLQTDNSELEVEPDTGRVYRSTYKDSGKVKIDVRER